LSYVGIGVAPLKSDVITHAEEAAMLASEAASLDTPQGLNQRMGYFATRNFFIRASQEIREVNSNQFQLVIDEFGEECLR
jgi:hypothetical protein